MSNLIQLLEDSRNELIHYQQQIELIAPDKSQLRIDHFKNKETTLINTLASTKSELQKQLQENRVAPIDPKMLQMINMAIDQFTGDKSTKDKVNTVHYAVFGTIVPFWNVLRDIQQLLKTIESLKGTRGKRASPVEGMGNL